jgi:hypothetical protein
MGKPLSSRETLAVENGLTLARATQVRERHLAGDGERLTKK